MKTTPLLAIALALVAVGCQSSPFVAPELSPMDISVDPHRMVENFRGKLPDRFSQMNSMVIEPGFFQRISTIGLIKADIIREEFTIVGLNPMGLKIFEISANKNGVTKKYAVEQLAARGDFAQAIVEDMRRIYFHTTPSPDARVIKEKYRIIFDEENKGKTRFIFAGTEGYLVEKKRYNKTGSLLWRVTYHERFWENGKLYTGGIVLDNIKSGYRLVIRNKKVNVYE